MSNNKVPSFAARLLAIYFTRNSSSTTIVNATTQITQSQSSTTFQVSNVALVAILGALGMYASGRLEHLGSFLGKIMGRSNTNAAAADQIQLCIVLANFNDDDVDLTKALDNLKTLDWKDETGKLFPKFVLTEVSDQDQGVLLNYRKAHKLQKDLLIQRTIYMLATKTDRDQAVAQLLARSPFNATALGDNTGSGGADGDSSKWAKGLFNRITTGGPNGSMAGKIAVNFMNTVPVASAVTASFDFAPKQSSNVFLDTSSPLGTILKDAVTSAAQAAAQGLADYLKTLNKPKTAAADADADEDDSSGEHQTATVVKGIKDSMPATGRTVAQLAVFNALGHKEMANLPRDEQLRIAYTVANATRTAVEATGNHVADLYQAGSIPQEHELAAAGVGGFLDFLKSVGTTIANGVIQAAPVVLNAITNSANANNALGSALPPKVSASNAGLHELDTPTKITLASRIVNGTPNPESNVVSDKAVSELADRHSNLGAQAALDTFSSINDPNPSQEKRNNFRDIALEVANISPTFSNVTDIGATNLVTDSNLKHAEALRQHALEMGIRSCANIIADHPAAEALFAVHQVQLKAGAPMAARGFLDFLKSAVPIAANIAKAAAPALLALI